MAYTVLARRYRSTNFDEVIGQDHIAKVLKRAIETDRLAHAYLFCGTRGTGKTSTARIFAKCLNCQSSDRPVTKPCGVCGSCLGIATGDDIDVLEIDAASQTGVDNVRDVIIAQAYNTPARSRFKIFVIDEVHMLSKQSFNALLKTLEEPPAHVKFILATTEPEKVLATIQSRCQRYDFRNIPTREIAGHLAEICKAEKIDADDDALMLVAKAGAGSMRDSLSLLDRLLSVGETHVTARLLEQMLGLPQAQRLMEVVAAIADGDVKTALSRTDAMITDGLSVESLIAALVDYFRNLLVVRVCGVDSGLVETPGVVQAELAAQAAKFDPAALSQDVVVLEELRRHVRQTQAGRALLDATLVRFTLADQFTSLTELLNRAAGLDAVEPPQKKNSIEVRPPPAAPDAPPPTPAPAPPVPPRPMPTANLSSDLDDEDDDLPAPGKVWQGGDGGESLSSLLARHKPAAAEPPNVTPASSIDWSTKWRELLNVLSEQHGPALSGLLHNGRLIGIDDGQAVVEFDRQNESLVKMIEKQGKRDLVRDVLSKVLEHPVGVRFELKESPQETPPSKAAPAAKPKAAQPPATPPPVEPVNQVRVTEELRTNLYKSEPLIKAVVDQLGGNIVRIEE